MCDKASYTSSDKEWLAAPLPDQQNRTHPDRNRLSPVACCTNCMHPTCSDQEVAKRWCTISIIWLLVHTSMNRRLTAFHSRDWHSWCRDSSNDTTETHRWLIYIFFPLVNIPFCFSSSLHLKKVAIIIFLYTLKIENNLGYHFILYWTFKQNIPMDVKFRYYVYYIR